MKDSGCSQDRLTENRKSRATTSTRYAQEHQRPLILGAAQNIRPRTRLQHAIETPGSGTFLQSQEWESWKRLPASAVQPEHFLLVKTYPKETTWLPGAVKNLAAELERPGGTGIPFDLAFHSAHSEGTTRQRAPEVLRCLLAQVITANEKASKQARSIAKKTSETPTDRLETMTIGTQKDLLQALTLKQDLQQVQYWNLLRALIGHHDSRPLLLVIDRVDLIDERDRPEFLSELLKVRERCEGGPWLRILVSGQPSHNLDHILERFRQFDLHRDFFGGMEQLRNEAHNVHQDQVTSGLPNTGNWLYQHPKYFDHSKARGSSMVCITGQGGSGKSTITKRLLDETRLRCNTPALADMMSPLKFFELNPNATPEARTGSHKVVASFFYRYNRHRDSSELAHGGSGLSRSLAALGSRHKGHIQMLCSLLYQILWQAPWLYPHWNQAYREQRDCKDWDFETLKHAFCSLRDDKNGRVTIYIFLDALNEALDENAALAEPASRRQVLDLLYNMSDSKNESVVWKIFLSTRDLGEHFKCMQEDNTIRITEHNRFDIEALVTDAMNDITRAHKECRCPVPEWKITHFKTELLEKANGVLLWIKVVRDLVIKRISLHQLTEGALRQYLEGDSGDMDRLYRINIEQLEDRHPEAERFTISNWLRWGTLALVPLRVPEFKAAVALSAMPPVGSPTLESFNRYRLEPDDEYSTRNVLVSNCGGFLEVKHRKPSLAASLAMKVQSLKFAWTEFNLVVEPTHHTARSFLFQSKAHPFRLSEKESHFYMAKACVRYLKLASTEEQDSLSTSEVHVAVTYIDQFAFLPYVLTNLPLHLSKVNADDREEIRDSIRNLFRKPNLRTDMRCILSIWASSLSRKDEDRDLWHHCASLLPFSDGNSAAVLTEILQTATKRSSTSAMYTVLAAGLLSIPTLATADVVESLILGASMSDHPRMQDVLLLLSPQQHGTIPVVQNAYSGILCRAIELSGSSHVCAQLLAAGAHVDRCDSSQRTPLHIAADQRHAQIVEMLLDAGAEIDAKDATDSTPLHLAVSNKHEMVVKSLLDRKAMVDLRDKDGRTPMSLCGDIASEDSETIRRLLVASGAKFPTPARSSWLTLPIPRSMSYIETKYQAQLLAILQGCIVSLEDSLHIVVLHGMGGMGKTQLAVESAYALRERHPNCSIFWIDGSSLSRIESSCEYLAQLVNDPGYISEQSPEKYVTLFLTWLSNTRYKWLLIVDNLDDRDLLADLIPKLTRGMILITSRDSGIAQAYSSRDHERPTITHDSIHLQRLSQKHAEKLLKHRLGLHVNNSAEETTHQQVAEIGTLLDGLPLAIVQAASFLQKTRLSLTEYMTLFKESETKTQILSEEFPERRGPLELPNAIALTWAISFKQIQKVNPQSSDILAFLGVLGEQGIPEKLLWILLESSTVNDLRVLHEFSFLQSDQDGVIRMHPLVHSATRSWLQEAGGKERWELHAFRGISLAFPPEAAFEKFNICKELMPHTEKVLEYARRLLPHVQVVQEPLAVEDRKLWIRLLSSVARYLRTTKLPRRAERLLSEARDVATTMGLKNTELDLDLQSELAIVRAQLGKLVQTKQIERSQGQYEAAEEMSRRALECMETALGKEHPETLRRVNNLALVFQYQGQYKAAEEMYQRALQGKEKAWGLKHTSTLDTVNNLGNLYRDQGKLAEAEEMYQRALQGKEKALGRDHTSTLDTVNNLGNLYADQGKLAEAEAKYQRALKGYQTALGPEHISTLKTVNDLGLLYSNQGKLAEAEAMYEQALESYQKAMGLEVTSTLETVNNLGILYSNQVKLAEAEAMHQRAFKGYQKALGPDHTSTLRTVNNLGNLYADQGKLAETEEMY